MVGPAGRAGRVELNGRLRTYSPLSGFEEVEILAMGVDGKKQTVDDPA